MGIPDLFKDIYLRIVFAVSLVLYAIVALFIIAQFIARREAVVLHFDAYRGIDLVGGRGDVFGMLFAGVALMAINFLLANFLYSRDRFFAYVLSFATLLLVVLFMIAMIVVYIVN